MAGDTFDSGLEIRKAFALQYDSAFKMTLMSPCLPRRPSGRVVKRNRRVSPEFVRKRFSVESLRYYANLMAGDTFDYAPLRYAALSMTLLF